jgi:hypothetical protein
MGDARQIVQILHHALDVICHVHRQWRSCQTSNIGQPYHQKLDGEFGP